VGVRGAFASESHECEVSATFLLTSGEPRARSERNILGARPGFEGMASKPPTRKRLRAGTPRVETREPIPETASLENLLSEIRRMREEQIRMEELYATKLLQRD